MSATNSQGKNKPTMCVRPYGERERAHAHKCGKIWFQSLSEGGVGIRCTAVETFL